MPSTSLSSQPRDSAIHVDTETPGVAVVCLEGEFDLTNADALRDLVDDVLQSGDHLIVDLSHVTFIDSSVLSVLFDGAKAADERNRTMILQVAAAPSVERTLDLVGIERVLSRAGSRNEAVQMIRQLDLSV